MSSWRNAGKRGRLGGVADAPATNYTRKKRREWRPKFLDALAHTGIVTDAARAAHIERKTAYDEYARNPKFAAAWEAALEQAIEGMEIEARRRAVEGFERPIYQGGELVGQVREYSDVLLIFMLKAHRPDKYRETTRHENYNVDLTQCTDEQLERLARGEHPLSVLAAARPGGIASAPPASPNGDGA